MPGFELTSIGLSLKALAELLDKLRKKPKERDAIIAEFQEAYFSVKEKALALYDENLTLNREIEKLKTDYAQEITRLNKALAEQIAEMTVRAQPKEEELGDVSKQMLITLANKGDRVRVTDGELIQLFGIQKAQGDFYFAQLRQRKLVNTGGGLIGRGTFWYVTDAGLKYLEKDGLLNAKPQKNIPPESDSGHFSIL